MKWYVDQFMIGYQVVQRYSASNERYPVSQGPFASENEAQTWAEENLD